MLTTTHSSFLQADRGHPMEDSRSRMWVKVGVHKRRGKEKSRLESREQSKNVHWHPELRIPP